LVVDEPNSTVTNVETLTNVSEPVKSKPGRPPSARHRRALLKHLRSGEATSVDKGWLIEQFLVMYNARGIRAQDKLRALELLARLSGYSGKEVEPEDEKAAIQALMAEMEKNA